MTRATEPTEADVLKHIARDQSLAAWDLASITVTHCFDMQHWLRQYGNKRALTAFVATGALGG
jgi:hypothetical protein